MWYNNTRKSSAYGRLRCGYRRHKRRCRVHLMASDYMHENSRACDFPAVRSHANYAQPIYKYGNTDKRALMSIGKCRKLCGVTKRSPVESGALLFLPAISWRFWFSTWGTSNGGVSVGVRFRYVYFYMWRQPSAPVCQTQANDRTRWLRKHTRWCIFRYAYNIYSCWWVHEPLRSVLNSSFSYTHHHNRQFVCLHLHLAGIESVSYIQNREMGWRVAPRTISL